MLPRFKYKGFEAQVEWSEDDGHYYGTVDGIEELVYFEGETIPDAYGDFTEAVNDYLGETK